VFPRKLKNASKKAMEIGYNFNKGRFEMPEYSISQLGKYEECALQYKFIVETITG
jgi:hypothetical protein